MSIFLTAEWRKLIMANYVIDPGILARYLPAKTELDEWQGKYYVSVVGFLFDKVRIKGIAVPFHTRFPEVNLRFYVKYKEARQWKRGVVFISEIVPKHAIALVANKIFKENYSVCRMKDHCVIGEKEISAGYEWRKGNWNVLNVSGDPVPSALQPGSKEEFITEHFWGYSKKNETQTVEYHVEHPRWDIYQVNTYTVKCDFGRLYGEQFAFLSAQNPESVFMADGSAVKIYGKKII